MQKEDPIKLIFEGLEMGKWNRSMDRAQRLDEKNGVICLIFIFTFGVTVNAMPKMVHFLHFMLMTARHQSQLGKMFKRIWKGLFTSFRKYYGLLDSEPPLARCQSLKILGFGIFSLSQQFFYISILSISQEVTSKPVNYTIFWKNTIRSFRCT